MENEKSFSRSLKIPDSVIIENLLKENAALKKQIDDDFNYRIKNDDNVLKKTRSQTCVIENLRTHNRKLTDENKRLKELSKHYKSLIAEEDMLVSGKLFKEVQKIIKYYSSYNYKPFPGDNDFTNILAGRVDMLTELAPYLEERYLPDLLISDSPRLTESHYQDLVLVAKNLRSQRKLQTPFSQPNDNAHSKNS